MEPEVFTILIQPEAAAESEIDGWPNLAYALSGPAFFVIAPHGQEESVSGDCCYPRGRAIAIQADGIHRAIWIITHKNETCNDV